MIMLGLGANLPSAVSGPPQATLAAALDRLAEEGVAILRRSPWYRSAPVPPGDRPWFVNGVAVVATPLGPPDLLALLHRVERRFGRVRRARNESRPLDLDILDYDGRIDAGDDGPILPHPRLHERAFVLYPLRDVAPDWHHAISGAGVADLIAALPPGQCLERLPE
ncbi:MAG: 2-amino-4-hydroxy-6-hydroxymethyldihydropteridine diphosphokinase [Stellaceae bacterium]